MNYLQYRDAFIKRHNKSDWHVETSPMDQYGTYIKTYVFEDGACLWEVNRRVVETAEVETFIHGVRVIARAQAELMETEVWTTDEPRSVKFYEEW